MRMHAIYMLHTHLSTMLSAATVHRGDKNNSIAGLKHLQAGKYITPLLKPVARLFPKPILFFSPHLRAML